MSMMTVPFIGRRKDLATLQQWLIDKDASPIFYIHDKQKEWERRGGIGKTWLLHQFYAQVAPNKNIIPVVVDFFNVLDRNGIVIATRMIEEINKKYPHWNADSFNGLLRAYHDAEQRQGMDVANLREQLTDALVSDLRQIIHVLRESGTTILFFFDTYEFIEYNPVVASLRTTLTFPDNYQLGKVFKAIIAGRNPIDWTHPNWVRREHEVLVHPLLPFDREETVHYLMVRAKGYDVDELAPEIIQALQDKTGGRPILLGLVTDVLNKQINEPEELVATTTDRFEASLVEEINKFGDPGKWVVLTMAHIYHRFDAAFLDRLLNYPGLQGYVQPVHFQDLVQELLTLSFMRRSTSHEEFVLHDEMRRLVNKYCWEAQDQDRRIRSILSQLALSYYDELIKQERNEEKRQSYAVEKLFHELFLDRDAGFYSFEEQFRYATDFSLRVFARSLVQEVKQFNKVLSPEQRLAMKLAEVKVYRGEENLPAAFPILVELEQDSEWVERHHYDYMYEKGMCYQRTDQYPEAVACFEECLQIARENRNRANQARLLNQLGLIYRVRGRYTEAMRYYEEALKEQRNLDDPIAYATLLNNIGNVLRHEGKLEDALRYCKVALRIRRDLFQQNKINEYAIALSLSTLGHIYHTLGEVKEEENTYQEAFEIYTRTGDKAGIASTYNRLGRLWRGKGDLQKANEYFQQAERIAQNVNRVVEIESYRQQGRILFSQKQWEQSLPYFEKALEFSQQAGLNFQIAENLLYCALALAYLDRPFRELIREAKRIARQNKYMYLLARAGELQGDMAWSKQEYQSAFKHYRVACRYMTARGAPEFNRIIRKMNDLLLEIPASFLPGVIDSLLAYWYELNLDKKYPELPAVCHEVSRHMLL